MASEALRLSFRDTRLASRKAEEAAQRRSQAATWLDAVAGPLDLPPNPSEKDFVASLRSGIALCRAVNAISPGAVPKVITDQSDLMPAYQYFENIRNFLVAVEELKLPSFEASDLERDNLEAGSVGKIVDCVLGLKNYYEWKQSGSSKNMKSPFVGRIRENVGNLGSSCSVRRLDLEKQQGLPVQIDDKKSEGINKVDCLVRALSHCLYDSKENVDQSLLDSWRQGTEDSTKLFGKILSSCLAEQELRSFLKDQLMEVNTTTSNLNAIEDEKCCNLHLLKKSSHHQSIFEAQEHELAELKDLLSRTRVDFSTLQFQLQNDFMQLGTQIQELSAAAVGYNQAVKENRHLYNLLQELRGNIRVFCRIRPSFHLESSIDYIGNDGSVMIIDPLKPHNSRKIFQFHKVFGPCASQEEVYKDTQALVRSVMDGYNVCIFAYGQTGSGKTHTMCGASNGPDKDRGINHMALNDLFELSRTRSDIKYEIQVQMVEIYNEQVRDLLCEDASTRKLEIRNCSGSGGLSLPDANMHLVQSTIDVLDLMKLGEKNRAFSSTAMNNRSSRSHSILTVHVHGKDVSGSMLNSCLHLVDLAGSERIDKSEVTGDRLKEAQHINKSLACLGDVMAALAQKNSHIPYRNSKLTQLLQNSLGGHAKMLMFAHVSPEADSYGETISTLKFAQRVSTVELGAAHVNKESSEVRQLKEEIDNLKKALAASKEGDKFLSAQKAERLKYTTEITPPRSRRLSIENSVTRKTAMTTIPDEKRVSRSPLPRPKLGSEYGPINSRRSSLEGPVSVKKKEDFKIPSITEDVFDVRVSLSNGSSSKVLPLEESSYASPFSCNSLSQSQILQSAESRINRKVEEVMMTPDNKTRNPIANSSKGSHIRKSLQTIGKFINGSERRTNPHPADMTPPAKFGFDNDIVIKSPVTMDARSRRRQSLTTMSISRRSSLGGQSIDTSSSGIKNTRTKTPPPAYPSTAKGTKRWM